MKECGWKGGFGITQQRTLTVRVSSLQSDVYSVAVGLHTHTVDLRDFLQSAPVLLSLAFCLMTVHLCFVPYNALYSHSTAVSACIPLFYSFINYIQYTYLYTIYHTYYCIIVRLVNCVFFLQELYTFIQQGCIKMINKKINIKYKYVKKFW